MNPLGLLLVAVGLFAICGAALNLEWFMNHRKARFVRNVFGGFGARIFYGLLGTGLVTLGVLVAIGVIQQRR